MLPCSDVAAVIWEDLGLGIIAVVRITYLP